MTRSKRSIFEKKMEHAIINFKLEEDRHGKIIAYCDYYKHKGIICNGRVKECLNRECDYLVIFRKEK